ncbi:radical SAM protein, partial [Pseudomonas aeruginosa]
MLKLAGKVGRIQLIEVRDRPLLLQVSTNLGLPKVLRENRAFLISSQDIPEGYQHYLIPESLEWRAQELEGKRSFTLLPNDYDYLGHNDIIRLDGQAIRVLFRANSGHNSLLVTEQCNHYCLMCSQPPKNIDDSWILDELEALIPLIPRETPEVGFSGGEPTLAGIRFINLIKMMKSYLPRTVVHVLSNGRTFADESFARQYAEIDHPDIMIGIPLYSDDP